MSIIPCEFYSQTESSDHPCKKAINEVDLGERAQVRSRPTYPHTLCAKLWITRKWAGKCLKTQQLSSCHNFRQPHKNKEPRLSQAKRGSLNEVFRPFILRPNHRDRSRLVRDSYHHRLQTPLDTAHGRPHEAVVVPLPCRRPEPECERSESCQR